MIARVRLAFVASVLALGLFCLLIAPVAHAGLGGIKAPNGQKLFEFGLLGSGPLTNPCTPDWGTCTLNAGVNGNVINAGSSLNETMAWSNDSAITSAGETCYTAAGNGTIVAKKGDQIDFIFNGLLCGDSDTFIPSSLNATYIVTGGTGRFATAVGSGNFTQNNFNVNNDLTGHPKAGAVVVGAAAIVRFDGTLTKGPAVKPQP